MITGDFSIPAWFELVAVLVGATNGAMDAQRSRFDIFGVLSLAMVTGMAGGIIRDVLLQDGGIYVFQNPSIIVFCLISGVVVFFCGRLVTYLDPVIDAVDNLGVGMWGVLGASKALAVGQDPIVAVLMGVITAVGGGILRDLCMNRLPSAFRAGAPYGIAVFIGVVVYVVLHAFTLLAAFDAYIGVGVVLALRYTSLYFGLYTHPARDYSDNIERAVLGPATRLASFIIPRVKKKGDFGLKHPLVKRMMVFFMQINGTVSSPTSRRRQAKNPRGEVDDCPSGDEASAVQVSHDDAASSMADTAFSFEGQSNAGEIVTDTDAADGEL